jgi:hypothetical protein
MRSLRAVLAGLAIFGGVGMAGLVATGGAVAGAQSIAVIAVYPSTLAPGTTYTDLSIEGAGFSDGDTVSLGPGVTVNSVAIESSTDLYANVSIAADAPLGSSKIKVAQSGESGACTTCFAVSYTPIVTSVSVLGSDAVTATLPQGAKLQTLNLFGTDFTPNSTVSFGAGSGVTVQDVSFEGWNSLQVLVSVGTTAPIQADNVTVTNPVSGDPSGSCNACFAVSDTPTVAIVASQDFSTPELPQGAALQGLNLSGTNFMPKATISFGAGSGVTVDSVDYIGPYNLTVTVTVSGKAPLQSDNVTVTNPVTGSPSGTCTACFTVSDTPTISSIQGEAPGFLQLPPGAALQTFFVYGTNFMANSAFSFGKGSGVTVDNTAYQGPGLAELTVSVSIKAPVQSDNLTVTNPAPGAPSGSCTGCLVVSNTPSVSLIQTSDYPASSTLPPGAADQVLFVYGSNFMNGALASFPAGSGITVDSVAYQNPTSLNLTVSVSADAPIQTDDLTVTNPGRGSTSGTCSDDCFAVSDTPTVDAVGTPGQALETATLPQGAKLQILDVEGTNFTTRPTVSFGKGSGVTVENVLDQGPSSLEITVSVSSSAPIATDDVTVTNPGNGSTSGTCTGCLSISDTPTLDPFGFSTQAGVTDTDVYIEGADFQANATVTFNLATGVTVNSVRYENSTQLIANITVASDAPAQVDDLTVTNPTAPAPNSATLTGYLTISQP